MKAIMQRTPELQWMPASELYGEKCLYNGREVIELKVLSDRRAEGGGMAYLMKLNPPIGKLIKLIAVAGSDEHVYLLQGGYCDRTGRKLRFPGDYVLNPKGHPHSAFVGEESVSLVVYAGEPDQMEEVAVVDPVLPQ
jgi:hypothetical protein